MLSHQSEGVATIWLSNGILFGVVITRPRREWLAYFLAGLTADTLADVFYGDPFRAAIGVSLANSVEVITSAVVLTRIFGHPLDLAKPRTLFGFLTVSAVGSTVLGSLLGALWTNRFVYSVPAPFFPIARTWYLGDMLGMVLLAPLTFMLLRPGLFTNFLRGKGINTALLLLAAPLMTALVFTDAKDPLIFLLFPVLLLIVFHLGFSGTIVSLLLIAFEAIALTIKGYGPLMLVRGDHMMLHRVIVVQVFLAVAMFSTFPVAALLEERASLWLSLAKSEERYRKLALSDDLTGLNNRRAFNLHLEQQWDESLTTGQPISALMIDADHFKSYNDLYGHVAGDACLRFMAANIRRVVPETTGFVSRFGGEEFAVILPGRSSGSACLVAEGIRQAIATARLAHAGSPAGLQTVSIGVATLVPSNSHGSRELISLADIALYQAKDEGRDCVVLHTAQQRMTVSG